MRERFRPWMPWLALLLVGMVSPALAQEPVRYRLDPGRSTLRVHVYSAGLLKGFGHDHTIGAGDLAGAARLTPETVVPAELWLTVRAGSLAVADEVSEKDRADIERTMHGKVLESTRYPDIAFRSSGVTVRPDGDGAWEAEIAGDLTLHGITRPVRIPARVALAGDTLHARGSFPLGLTDYGIEPVTVLLGTIRVRDEVELSFDILARRAGE